MTPRTTRDARTLLSGHSTVRLLIVSWFVALALHLIPGTDMSALLDPFLPSAAAEMLTSAVILTLSAMIVIGLQRRAAALLLALLTFWASYIGMISAPVHALGAFWRDLALIGALVMTYADRAPATHPGSDQSPTTPRAKTPPQGTRRIDPDLFRQDLARVR
ncbi:hypothetical protein GQ651_04995 [Alphaproteobacteria bacterium GH1-50]|uniref:DoxX family protein n=1 Tax=Kangsaoukella pontilimi TaxID=2691042 RepID=A0A7C9MEP1_9RHOB|nr:hypothetical protein [Kangsaoukella pontilimi]MXQ07196.1 hypothetical protein [Kangsaoukella pontilimi]